MELAKQEKPLRVVCLPEKNTGDYSTTRVQKQSGKIKTNFITQKEKKQSNSSRAEQ